MPKSKHVPEKWISCSPILSRRSRRAARFVFGSRARPDEQRAAAAPKESNVLAQQPEVGDEKPRADDEQNAAQHRLRPHNENSTTKLAKITKASGFVTFWTPPCCRR